MSFLSRLLGYKSWAELGGATMEEGERWVIRPARETAAFMRSLPILFPTGAFAYFEGTTQKHFAEWLAAHSISSPLKIAQGTIWPKPDTYHLPLSTELMEEAAALVDDGRIECPAIHFHVHDGRAVLLEWHDAFGNDPIYVGVSVPRDRIEEFARVINAREVWLRAV